MLEAVWDAEHVEQVEVLWEETLALEGRAGYYDDAGALKDVMQNHMLQVLLVVAMEPPAARASGNCTTRKVAVLRSTHAHRPTRRGRYTAGASATAPSRPTSTRRGSIRARGTETFAEVALELDTPRWARTDASCCVPARRSAPAGRRPLVRFRESGASCASASMARSTLRAARRLGPAALTGSPPASELPAYGHVLLDLLEGRSTLSVRGDEAEEAWRVVEPVLATWRDGLVPLEEYPAGRTDPPTCGSGHELAVMPGVLRALRRLPPDTWLVLQSTLAATVAWVIANRVVGNPEPFFAPIAAVVALNASLGERGLNAVRLLLGVVIGIVAGELTVAALGGGYASLALAVFAATGVARALGGVRIVIAQAAAGAILTVAVANGEAGTERLVDALIGVGVALLFTQVLFSPSPSRCCAAPKHRRWKTWRKASGRRREPSSAMTTTWPSGR